MMLYSLYSLRLWLVFCLLGLCMIMNAGSASPTAAQTPIYPIVLNASVTPSALPAIGGAVIVNASYTDYNIGASAGLSYEVIYDNGNTDSTGFYYDANGRLRYDFGSNSSSTARRYVVRISVSDQWTTTTKNFTVIVAGAKPIALNASVSPSALPAVGGAVTISITPQDPNGSEYIYDSSYEVYLGNNSNPVASGSFLDSKTGSSILVGDTATSTFNLPANSGATAQTYTVKVYGTDSTGTYEQDIPFTVAGAKPIVLNATFTPAALPAAGGAVTISITPQDANGEGGVDYAYYSVYDSNGNPVNINGYGYSNSFSDNKTGTSFITNGDTATSTFNLPANSGATAQTYTIKVYGTDSTGTTEDDIPITQAVFLPIAIAATVTPTNPPAANGAIVIHATATDTNGGSITGLTFNIIYNNNGTSYSAALGNFDGSGNASVNLSTNGSSAALTYTVKIFASDQAGTTEKDIPITQAAFQPIAITASVTPRNPAAANGLVIVHAMATDTNGGTITDLRYELLDANGSSYAGENYFDGSGNASINFSTNGGSTVAKYTIRIVAVDQAGYTYDDIPITQTAFQPIAITASVTPTNPPAANGTITIHASVADTNGGTVSSVYYEIINPNGVAYYSGSFDSTGTAIFNYGTNSSSTPYSYTVRIIASDQAGTTTKDIPVTQAAFQPITIKASITPQNLPAANGLVTIHATATDTNGGTITGLSYSIVYSNGYSVAGGGFDSSGDAKYDFGTNAGKLPILYTVRFVASDQAGNTTKDILITQAGQINPADKTLGQPGDGQPLVGEPINVATGNVYDRVTDYQTAGANTLGFTRYYNSLNSASPFPGMMGQNWRNNFDRYLWLVSATTVGVERADGQVFYFNAGSSGWTSDSDVGVRLTQSGSNWTLTDTADSVETYTSASSSEAMLTSIKARGGYMQALSYNTANQLASVTDSYNRSLGFTYQSGLLQTVTTPDGLVLTYGYDASGQSSGGLDRLKTVTYSTDPVTSQTYLYENSNLPMALTAIIDENDDRYISWTYDPASRGLTSQFGSGATLTTVSYNDTDGSRTVTTALGQQEIYKFTALQGISKVASITRIPTSTTVAATKTFTYDGNGYKASEKDWNGNMTIFVNDSLGRVTKTVEAAGTPLARTTTISYNGSFHLPTTLIAPQLTTNFTYDTNGNLLTKTLIDTTSTTVPYTTYGQTRTYTYTWKNALLTSVQNPRTDVDALTSFAYDGTGTLVKTTDALGQTVQVTQHTPGGLPLTVMDANGVTTQFTYDMRQRMTSSTIKTTTGPLTTRYAYNASGELLTTTLPDGSAIASAYDTAHRLTGLADLLGQTITYTLDADGNSTKTRVANASGVVTRQQTSYYDALGRLILDVGGANQQTRHAYDANGNDLTITKPLSRTYGQTFDALNRLTAVRDPLTGVTMITYDTQNHPQTVIAPNGGRTTYVYDGFGEVIEQSSPDTKSTIYTYDLDGNVTQKRDASSAVTNYAYDALDRVTATTYPADVSENATFAYDQTGHGFGVGRLTSVKDIGGTINRSYDERGNLSSETRQTGSATLMTAYRYDGAGRITGVAYPSGCIASYVRDTTGRTTSVALTEPGASSAYTVASSIGYQPFGPVTSLLFGNDVSETRRFDGDYRLTRLTDSGIHLLQDLFYGYNTADDVLSLYNAETPHRSQSFQYDALDRLTLAEGGNGTFVYSYDAVGNRLTQRIGPVLTSYSYVSQTNQLSTVTSKGVVVAVGYTSAGNINSIGPSPVTSLTYNQAGRLSTVASGTQPVAQYFYDAFGQRLAKTSSAGSTLFQYDQQGQLLEEDTSNGTPVADYVYLDDGRLIATFSPATGSLNYIHVDRLGTPQIVTNSAQAVTWAATYQPFGQATVTGSATQNLRLPGQYADAETGWYQNGFRDYVPGLGRYLESDPIGLNGGLNTYAYTNNSPMNGIDPSGTIELTEIIDKGNELKEKYDKAKEYYDKAKDYFDLGKNTATFIGALNDPNNQTSAGVDRVTKAGDDVSDSLIRVIPGFLGNFADPLMTVFHILNHGGVGVGALDYQTKQLLDVEDQLGYAQPKDCGSQ